MLRSRDLFELLAFFLFLIPVYITRVILYEQRNIHASIAQGIQAISHLQQLCVTIVITLTLANGLWFTLVTIVFSDNLENAMRGLARVLVAVLPFYVLMIWSNLSWPNSNIRFTFRYKNFFPAVATCLIPFVLGWSLSTNDIFPLLFSVVSFLSAWLLSLVRWRVFLWLAFLLMTLAIIAYLVSPVLLTTNRWDELLRLLLFGLLMTCVMGVSESWRVIRRITDKIEYVPETFPPQLEDTYRAGVHIAMAVFLPCFFVTLLHPATTYPYFYCSLVVLGSQFILWLTCQKLWTYIIWSRIGVGFGLALPVIVAVTTAKSRTDFQLFGLSIGDSLSDAATFIAIALTAIAFLEYRFAVVRIVIPHPKLQAHNWSSLKLCSKTVAFAAFISALLLILVSIALFVQAPFRLDASFINRLKMLQVIYAAFTFLLTIFSFFLHTVETGDESEREIPNLPQIDEQPHQIQSLQSVSQLFLQLVISGRPQTSLLAMLITAAMITIHDSISVLGALLQSLPIFLITMAGFLLNDVFDRKKDKLGGVMRPICQGLVSIPTAIFTSLILFCCAILLSGLCGSRMCLLATTCIFLGVVVYSPFSHRFSAFKGAFTSILACSPFAYASVFTGVSLSLRGYFLVAMFIFGRELLLDIKDREVDRRFGMRTLPHILGVDCAYWLSFLIMILSTSGMALSAASALGKVFALLAFIITALCFVQGKSRLPMSIALSRAAILVGGWAVAIDLL